LQIRKKSFFVNTMNFLHPILTRVEASNLERTIMSDIEQEWSVMQLAGRLLGLGILQDLKEQTVGVGHGRSILVICGKGHNTADALLAVEELSRHCQDIKVDLVWAFGREALKPLTERAWGRLATGIGDRCRHWEGVAALSDSNFCASSWDICIDGLLGLQFHPPLSEASLQLMTWVNQHPSIGLRASVDLPSGISEERVEIGFRADFTYATGSIKLPLTLAFNAEWVGRIRYLDLGFFEDNQTECLNGILLRSTLSALNAYRPSAVHKRQMGHVFIIGGSRSMPGAVLMAAQAALLSGAGLVTIVLPSTLTTRLASALPEAMWLGLPVDRRTGVLDVSESVSLLRKALPQATSVLVGPGLELDGEMIPFVSRVLRIVSQPIVVDASALHPDILSVVSCRLASEGEVVLTPHWGEYRRMLDPSAIEPDAARLMDLARTHKVSILLKGSLTRITDGRRMAYSPYGGPVLARGGSGDMLAGMIAALIGSGRGSFEAACMAAVWHGLSADLWARERGATAVRSTELLQYLNPALRGVSADE
jgi:NAD(P)H-hydrate epimerase